MSEKTQIYKQRGTQDLSAGALSLEFEAPFDCYYKQATIGFASAVSQTAAVTKNSEAGSAYDVPLDSSALISATSYVHDPGEKVPLKKGDKITLSCTNSGTPSIVASAEIIFEAIA